MKKHSKFCTLLLPNLDLKLIKKANPDLTVTLELKMYDPTDDSINHSVSGKYIFTLEDLAIAQNVETGKYYTDLQVGLNEAEEEQTVKMLQNIDTAGTTVIQGNLDLNGYTLTTGYMAGLGNIIDSSDDNNGLLTVSDKKFLIQEDNVQIPVKCEEGYRFIEIIGFNKAISKDRKFVFQPLFETGAHQMLLKESSETGVTINARILWKNENGEDRVQRFVYTDEYVKGFVESYKPATGKYGKMFTLLISNMDINTLDCEAYVLSEKGVEYAVVVE